MRPRQQRDTRDDGIDLDRDLEDRCILERGEVPRLDLENRITVLEPELFGCDLQGHGLFENTLLRDIERCHAEFTLLLDENDLEVTDSAPPVRKGDGHLLLPADDSEISIHSHLGFFPLEEIIDEPGNCDHQNQENNRHGSHTGFVRHDTLLFQTSFSQVSSLCSSVLERAELFKAQ
ncbi:MAG: hypothetical protein BWZ01_01925 [Deltaproteobacteria bacterium ADurb.BinA179]|nr:MAG: hypothetical protein BWZ01_01925 [Deltaproteobacteria bacterium ADurb.BinA179]